VIADESGIEYSISTYISYLLFKNAGAAVTRL